MMNTTTAEFSDYIDQLHLAALEYAEAGFSVLPVALTLDPETGKKNCRLIDDWVNASTRSESVINEWFTSAPIWTGLAIDCGKSGIVAIDLDVKDGIDGVEEWAKLGGSTNTPMVVRTQSGGRHLLFRDPSGKIRNSAGEVGPGIDIRGNGGLIYAAPTRVFGGGGTYSLENGIVPVDELPEIPDELVEIIEQRQGRKSSVAKFVGPWRVTEERAKEEIDRRKARLAEGTGYRSAIFGLAAGIAQFETAKAARDGSVVDEDSLLELVAAEVAELVPWPSLNGDDYQWIAEGVEKGTAQPWELVEIPETEGSALDRLKVYKPDARNLSLRACTESGNAERIARYVAGYVAFVDGLGWLVWNGKVWEPNESAVRELIRRFNKRLWDDLAEVGKGEENPTGQQFSFVNSMGKASKIRATMDILSAMPEIAMYDVASFDANPYLVSVLNGTVDLRDGTLHPHRREDLITMLMPVEYNPAAEAPRWERFLHEIFPNQPETPGFVQRLFGYSMTGHNHEHIFPVFNGRGRNGKSVLLDVVMDIFGPLGTKVLRGAFDADGGSTKETELASLRGRRLALLSETNQNLVMDEALVKEATGDGSIKGRHLYGRSFEFRRSFQLIMVTNHRPDFRSQGEALWDRVRLVEFERYFAEHEREKGLDTYLMTHEREGIFRWLVEGAVQYHQRGLDTPEAVLNATKSYQADTDKLAEFLASECVVDPDAKAPASTVWKAYQDWANDTLGKPDFRSNRAFYSAMDEKGFTKALGHRKQAYLYGVRLMTDAEKLAAERKARIDALDAA